MVVAIVFIVMVASVIRAWLGGGRSKRRHEDEAVAIQDNAESQRLREEVKTLKERLAVLERITIEKENSLEREIEQLRDR